MAHIQTTRRCVSYGSLDRHRDADARRPPRLLDLSCPLQGVHGNIYRSSSEGQSNSTLSKTAGLQGSSHFSTEPASALKPRWARPTSVEIRPRSGDDDLEDDRKRLPSYRDLTCEAIALHRFDSLSTIPASSVSSSDNAGRRSCSMTTCSSRYLSTRKSEGTIPSRPNFPSLQTGHPLPQWANSRRAQPLGSCYYHSSSESSDNTSYYSPATSITPLLERTRSISDAEAGCLGTTVIRSRGDTGSSVEDCVSDGPLPVASKTSANHHGPRSRPDTEAPLETAENGAMDPSLGAAGFRRHKRHHAVAKVRLSALSIPETNTEEVSKLESVPVIKRFGLNNSEQSSTEDTAALSIAGNYGTDIELLSPTPSSPSDLFTNPNFSNAPAAQHEHNPLKPRHSKLKLHVSRGALAKAQRHSPSRCPTPNRRPRQPSQGSIYERWMKALSFCEQEPSSTTTATTTTTTPGNQMPAVPPTASWSSRRWDRYFHPGETLSSSSTSPPVRRRTRSESLGNLFSRSNSVNVGDSRVFRRLKKRRAPDLGGCQMAEEAGEERFSTPPESVAMRGDSREEAVVGEVGKAEMGDGSMSGLDRDQSHESRPRGFRGRMSGWMRSAKRSIVGSLVGTRG